MTGDNSRDAVARVRPGDIVHFDLPIGADGQIMENSTFDEVVWDFEMIYNLGGPIWVDAAKPGDTLEVEILDLSGAVGMGGNPSRARAAARRLPARLPEDLRSPQGRTRPGDGERFRPIEPFLGVLGVHTDEPGRVSPFPPHRGGGDVDNRHLVVGSTLWLPSGVKVPSSRAVTRMLPRVTERCA